MNAQSKIEASGLSLMRLEFPPHQISKLPKETRAQIDARKSDRSVMVWNCEVCGSHHHKNAVHLDYVGHAALTDRLLDADPQWSWEPLALNASGLPALDGNGGLWIKLTICGVTRLGYGAADGKQGGDAIKEIIGDALRNAAMRFGAALDLWHKGDLHLDEPENETAGGHSNERSQPPATEPEAKAVRNWGGRYPTKSKLWAACRSHHAELERLGNEATLSDLQDFTTSPEYSDYVATALEHFPWMLEGPAPETMPEYVPTFKIEAKARDLIALRGNVPADKEAA